MIFITPEQLEEIYYCIGEYPDLEEWLLENLDLRSLEEIPRDKFGVVITRLRDIVNSRNGIK